MSDCQYSNAELGNASGFLRMKILHFRLTSIGTTLNFVERKFYCEKGFMRKQFILVIMLIAVMMVNANVATAQFRGANVTDLTSLTQLAKKFNEDHGKIRLVLLLSPT